MQLLCSSGRSCSGSLSLSHSWSSQWQVCALRALKVGLPTAAAVASLERNAVSTIAAVTAAARPILQALLHMQSPALLTCSTGEGLFHMTQQDAHATVLMAQDAAMAWFVAGRLPGSCLCFLSHQKMLGVDWWGIFSEHIHARLQIIYIKEEIAWWNS